MACENRWPAKVCRNASGWRRSSPSITVDLIAGDVQLAGAGGSAAREYVANAQAFARLGGHGELAGPCLVTRGEVVNLQPSRSKVDDCVEKRAVRL